MHPEPDKTIKELNDETEAACEDIYKQRHLEVRVAVSEGIAMASALVDKRLETNLLRALLECITLKIMRLDESK